MHNIIFWYNSNIYTNSILSTERGSRSAAPSRHTGSSVSQYRGNSGHSGVYQRWPGPAVKDPVYSTISVAVTKFLYSCGQNFCGLKNIKRIFKFVNKLYQLFLLSHILLQWTFDFVEPINNEIYKNWCSTVIDEASVFYFVCLQHHKWWAHSTLAHSLGSWLTYYQNKFAQHINDAKNHQILIYKPV